MSIITLEEAKLFLKVDYEEEDSEITMLIEASELYLQNATGKEFTSDNKLAVLYCKVLISDWFNNRELMANGKVSEKVRFTLQSILVQLQCYEVPDEL